MPSVRNAEQSIRPILTNYIGGGFHWQPAMFDNSADVKCCFSIFCTIIICE